MDELMQVAGQQLSTSEAHWSGVTDDILAHTTSIAAVSVHGRLAHCHRCGADFNAAGQRLPIGWVYCPECIVLGRLTDNDVLWRFPQAQLAQVPIKMTWQGQLTPAQQRVAGELIADFDARKSHLLWAVTGAGKTEMLFPVLEHALNARARVAIVSPRVDVILELAPRLAAAFTTVPQAVRYGGSGPAPTTRLMLATVHQLLRYRAAFDLIVVDEVDAFPYSADPMLERAVNRAGTGAHIFLTATPSQSLLKQVRAGTLGISYLPRRFHGAPLPEPKIVCRAGADLKIPRATLQLIARVMKQVDRLLVFVPKVAQLVPVQKQLRAVGIESGTVHAAEPERIPRVRQLRDGKLSVLVTTTILERGVTFPHCGVIVINAEAPIFSTAALVQMAGRAGRAREHPDDPVYFVCRKYTRRIAAAVRQIRHLNARKVE